MIGAAPEFLTLDEVVELHRVQLARYGGASGIRDVGLLESAVAQPQATFDGQFVHEDLVAMGAAYLFHLVQNHAFVDGNKRVGLLAALVFLDLNGITLNSESEALYDLTMGVASGEISKSKATAALRRIARLQEN